jgi:hypothetical protein
MDPTLAAILMIVWPGHDIPPTSMPSLQACQDAQAAIVHAAEDRPGFRGLVRA